MIGYLDKPETGHFDNQVKGYLDNPAMGNLDNWASSYVDNPCLLFGNLQTMW